MNLKRVFMPSMVFLGLLLFCSTIQAQQTNVTQVNPSLTGDDTDQLTALINAGGRIILGPGTFYVSSLLQMPSSPKQVDIGGGGIGVTSIKTTSASAGIFKIPGGNNGIHIHDLELEAGVPQTAGAFIEIDQARDVTIDNVRLDAPYIGISVTGGAVQFFSNLDIVSPVNRGMVFSGGNDQFLRGVEIDGNPNAQPGAGIEISNTGAVWMDSTSVLSCGTGLLIDPQNGQAVTWLFISNSAFDSGNGIGLLVAPASGGTVRGATFMQDWFSTNSGRGVTLSGAGVTDGVRFIGARIFNNGQDGFGIDTTSVINVEVQSSDLSGNSGSSIGTYSGITICAGCSKFSLNNNTIGTEVGFAVSQNRGIIVNPGSSNNYVITGNNLLGNTTSILDLGTGTNKIIAKNLGVVATNNSGNTPAQINGSATSVVVNHGLYKTPAAGQIVVTLGSSLGSGSSFWVDTITNTSFTIHTASSPNTAVKFNWYVSVE